MKDLKEYNYLDLFKSAIIIGPISFSISIIFTVIYILRDLIIWRRS